MQALVFYIVYSICWMVAWLPLRFLYVLSDLLYFPLYYLSHYRLKVVRMNLSRAFPGKEKQELLAIEKKFYRHLCDLLFEMVWLMHASPAAQQKRISYENPELLKHLYTSGKQVIAVVGHYGNWEWLSGLASATEYRTLSVYKPLNNAYFDTFLKRLREKNGTEMVKMRRVIKSIIIHQAEGELTLNCFISDQSPVWQEVQYWTEFMNQDTAVYLGIEKLAKHFDMPVIFYRMQKKSRGHYSVRLVPVTIEPAGAEPFAITKKHTRLLEDLIREKPEYWLWTHRRWKLTEKKTAMESAQN